jgi:UDP-glucose 4-epimerase
MEVFMRILVTGGAGFIGSHVVDTFLAAGHEVAVLDNLSAGKRANVHHEARLYVADVCDRDAVATIFDDFHPEVVDHHAAQAKVPVSMANPALDVAVNLVGGVNILRQAVAGRVRKIIFSSTGGALYGEPEVIPCDEGHPIRPLSPYGTSKYCFEQYLATFKRTFGMDYTILRYANVYGTRQDLEAEEGRLVAIFATRMLANGEITIDGTGEQARDLLYVADAAVANLAALTSGSGEAYNLGTGQAVSVNEVFRRLGAITGYARPPRHGPARQGDVYRIALDSRKAGRELGWEPRVALDDGLRAVVSSLKADGHSGAGQPTSI